MQNDKKYVQVGTIGDLAILKEKLNFIESDNHN